MFYEIRLKGRAERTIVLAFDDFTVSAAPSETVLRGDIVDQAALHGVLERIHGLGLHLLEVRAVGPERTAGSE